MKVVRNISYASWDGRDIWPENGKDPDLGNRLLDVYTPDTKESKKKLPVLVLVTGLGWLQLGTPGGLAGFLGGSFNQSLGKAIASCGWICVQVQPRGRHIGQTTAVDVLFVALAFPLFFLDWLFGTVAISQVVNIVVALPFQWVKYQDILVLLLAPALWHWGVTGQPVAVFLMISLRYMQHIFGYAAASEPLDTVSDLALACSWTQKHIAEYNGDNQHVFLAGYSSGGQAAALYAMSATKDGIEAPSVHPAWQQALKDCGNLASFKGVILISGIYMFKNVSPNSAASKGEDGMVTQFFSIFCRKFIGDVFGLNGKDIEERLADLSPLVQAEKWTPTEAAPRFVLVGAANELFGYKPLENLLFGSSAALAKVLRKRGAKVDEITAGSNHWEVALSIRKVCEPILKTAPFAK